MKCRDEKRRSRTRNRLCRIEGCISPSQYGTLCVHHKHQIQKHGKVRPDIPRRRSRYAKGTLCCIEGCCNPVAWNEMCVGHNKRKKRGKLNLPYPIGEARKHMTFIGRGGNGQLTKQQLAIHKVTNLPMEHAINTAMVKHKFHCLPHCYKVDLAHIESRLAIEVDGESHKMKKWQYLDRRKTEVLNALGWRVIRFANKYVDSHLKSVVDAINDAILGKPLDARPVQIKFSF